jgi:GntR family transcriptional regulator
MIKEGVWKVGERLPTERELMEQGYGSRTTIRSALAELAQRRVVESRQGYGTVVLKTEVLQLNMTRSENLDHRVGYYGQDSWNSDVIAAGRTPLQTFELIYQEAAGLQAHYLGASDEEDLVVRRCDRFVDGQAAMVETSWFPPAVVESLPRIARPKDIAEGTTVYMAENGFPELSHQDRIRIEKAEGHEREFLGLPLGVDMLVRWRITVSAPGGTPVRVMKSAYRGDMFELVYDVPGRGLVKAILK